MLVIICHSLKGSFVYDNVCCADKREWNEILSNTVQLQTNSPTGPFPRTAVLNQPPLQIRLSVATEANRSTLELAQVIILKD